MHEIIQWPLKVREIMILNSQKPLGCYANNYFGQVALCQGLYGMVAYLQFSAD